jgi:hypothetical protein
MSMVSRFRNLLTTRMTRKEFLIHLGIVTLTVLGISSYINQLKKLNFQKSAKKTARKSYGFGAYGV